MTPRVDFTLRDKCYTTRVNGLPAEIYVAVRKSKPRYGAMLYLDADYLGDWETNSIESMMREAKRRVLAHLERQQP